MKPNVPPLHLAVVVCNPTRDGGMQKFSRFIVESALTANWHVTVACSCENIYEDLAARWNPSLRVADVDWLDKNNTGDRSYRWSTIANRWTWFRRTQPDVALFVQSSNTPYRSAIVGAYLAGVRIISTHRTMAWERDFTPSRRHLRGLLPGIGWHRKRLVAKTWLTAALADTVVCNSNRVSERYQQLYHYPARKMQVIPNAVHLPSRPESPPSNGPVRIGYVGRISREKRLDVLLEALAVLPSIQNSDVPDWRLVLYGNGPDEAKLRTLVGQLNITERVQWMGRPADITTAYAHLDIVVLCSPRESSSNMILEAMAAGKTVVVTDAGGLPELVDHGHGGKIVPALNAEALSCTLRELIGNPQQRTMLGQQARRRAECVHHEPVIRQRWLDLISRTAARKQGFTRDNAVPTAMEKLEAHPICHT